MTSAYVCLSYYHVHVQMSYHLCLTCFVLTSFNDVISACYQEKACCQKEGGEFLPGCDIVLKDTMATYCSYLNAPHHCFSSSVTIASCITGSQSGISALSYASTLHLDRAYRTSTISMFNAKELWSCVYSCWRVYLVTCYYFRYQWVISSLDDPI